MVDKRAKKTFGVHHSIAAIAAKRYRTDKVQVAIIQSMYAAKHTVADIARAAKCTRATVYLWARRKTDEPVSPAGRPRTVCTPEVMDAVKKIVHEHRGKPLIAEQLRSLAAKETGVDISVNMLQHIKKELGIKGKKGMKKPERAYWLVNRRKRLACVRKRAKWNPAMRRRIIWLDESCGSRQMSCWFQQPANKDGTFDRPSYPFANNKEENVHFLCFIGNGVTFFHALAVRRPVNRDKAGKAIYPKGKQRRKAGKAANRKLNLPNEGETWTAERLKKLMKPHIKTFKDSAGVVLDNASSHKELRAYLEEHGVTVFDHPPHSPDLNLAENFICDIKRAARTDSLPVNNAALKAAYERVTKCSKHKKQFIERHNARCDEFPNRLKELRKKQGLPTSY